MPGMPPGASSLQGGQGAPASGRGGRPATAKKGLGNPQLMRNLVIVGSVLLVLLLIASAIGTRVLNQRTVATSPAPVPVEDKKPIATRGDRSNEEILTQAHQDFQRGQVYFREAAVGDENLWESIRYYQRAEAELALVDTALWPPFAREIAPKIQRAEGMLDQEYRRIKMSFVGYYQSADWRRAGQELELLMRIIPDNVDPRFKWAKKNKAKVKKRLRSMPKKKGPL
jgi:hypothetical protein